jgi:hypothetical protein
LSRDVYGAVCFSARAQDRSVDVAALAFFAIEYTSGKASHRDEKPAHELHATHFAGLLPMQSAAQ